MVDQKRILFVDNFKLDFDNPMSTLYINKCKKICESPLVHKVDITERSSVLAALQTKYDIVLIGQRCPEFYKCNKCFYKVIRWNLEHLFQDSNRPRIEPVKHFMLLQDTHPKTYGSLTHLTDFINKHKLDLIFTFYDNSESRHIRNQCPNQRFFHLPHHIDTNIFYPISENMSKNQETNSLRPYDIILYGDTHPTHYPFRKRLFELLLRESHNLKILHISPPVDPSGKGKIFDPDKCEAGLAAKIRSAKYAIATKSKYDYFVAKYLEISACGTVVIGDMATDGLNLPEFNGNYVKINCKMTDKQIMEIIVDAVKNYDTSGSPVSLNRSKHAKHVLDNYNLVKYQEKLINILTS